MDDARLASFACTAGCTSLQATQRLAECQKRCPVRVLGACCACGHAGVGMRSRLPGA